MFVMKTLLKLQPACSPGGIFMFLLNDHTSEFHYCKAAWQSWAVALTLSSKTEVSVEQIRSIQQ